MGRPSLYTPELAQEITDRLSKGEPLAVICRDDHMPAVRTVSHWKEADASFLADFARAREEGHDAIAAECLEIADDGRNDYMVRVSSEDGEDSAGAAIYNSEHVQRSKIRIETRLKLLAKWDKRYADRTVHAGDPDAPLLGISDDQLDERLNVLLAKAEAR